MEAANSTKIVVKSGLWYTISNFLFKGMSFLTIPIFSRMLSQEDYGAYSNFAAWMLIMIVVTGMDLQSSIIRSKLEFEQDLDSYIFSLLSFNTVVTIILYFIVVMFKDFFVNLFGFDMNLIHVMFAYLLVSPAYTMLMTKQRAFYKYKAFSILTGISTIASVVCSILFIFILSDKFLARVLGQYAPMMLLGAVSYFLVAYKGKKIKLNYWKYGFILCAPMVPHLISLMVLGTSDKIFISNYWGIEYTAIYSIAYSCTNIVAILLDSMNKAWAPWLIERLHHEDYKAIKKNSSIYFLVFAILVLGILLVGPELIFILGGKNYKNAVYCLPPLIVSIAVQFVYTMYVNIEFYKKRTMGIAIATILSALSNIVLNIIFIPKYGYIAASYTTLIGMFILLLLHYYLVKRLAMENIFNKIILFGVLIIMVVLIPFILFLYSNIYLRYIMILIYTTLIIIGLYNLKKVKNKKKV